MPLDENVADLSKAQIVKAAQFVAGLYIGTEVLSGPLKVLLFQTSLAPLYYIPKVLLLALPLIHILITWKVSIRLVAVMATIMIACATNLAIFTNPEQTVFGLYILAPFLYTLYFGEQLIDRSFLVFAKAAWAVATIGVAVNIFIEFPWATAELTLGDTTMTAVRQWSTNGISRIAGFSGASYSAATQIMALGVLIICQGRQRLKIVYFALTFLAVTATTTKGAMGALLVFALFYVWRWKLAYSATAIALLAANVVLPLYAYSVYSKGTAVDMSTPTETYFGFISIHTMFERANWMWPMSLEFIFDKGNALLGLGIGGVGTPLSRFYDNTLVFASADSLFIYLFGSIGLLAIALLIFTAHKAAKLQWEPSRELFPKLLIITTLAYGITNSPVERGVYVFLLGIALASRPKAIKAEDRF